MNLDKIQVNATLRSGWQAIDLGFLMAHAWWWPIFLAGAIPALIVFIPSLIFFFDNPFWAGFIVWWLKPFWERLPLHIASRRLFQDEPGYGEIIGRTRHLLTFDMLPFLLWRRLSVQRAFNAPVTVLEDLMGSSRSDRLRVLHGKYSDVALGNQFVCFCFELIFALGLIVLIAFFTPDAIANQVYDSFDELSLVGEWMVTVAAFIAMTIVMPFHTMAGFALYLNRRIELEAWDIEINFRSLANRKQQASSGMASLVMAMLLTGLVSVVTPVEAAVEHDRDSAAQLIEQVLQGESFGQEKTVRKWRFKGWSEAEEETFPEWLIDFFEWWEENMAWTDGLGNAAGWLKIILIVGFVVLILYLFKRYRGPLAALGRSRREEAAPEVLFGLDVRPESLPRDVPAEVLAMWREGTTREALSLLYRASLSRLIDKHALAFRASHTEAECATLVREQGIDSLSSYFSKLTNVWRRLAYGHELPAGEIIQSLCDDWVREMSDEPA